MHALLVVRREWARSLVRLSVAEVAAVAKAGVIDVDVAIARAGQREQHNNEHRRVCC